MDNTTGTVENNNDPRSPHHDMTWRGSGNRATHMTETVKTPETTTTTTTTSSSTHDTRAYRD